MKNLEKGSLKTIVVTGARIIMRSLMLTFELKLMTNKKKQPHFVKYVCIVACRCACMKDIFS